MPTRPDRPGGAERAARDEAVVLARVAGASRAIEAGTEPVTEARIIVFHDPQRDLDRRAWQWGHRLPDYSVESVALFAAGLAEAEAEAWSDGDAAGGARAFSERRHLTGDRMIHWAVPWLMAVASAGALQQRDPAGDAAVAARELLEIGDRHRLAPLIAGSEGEFPPGEDAYGPLLVDAPFEQMLSSLWSGLVTLETQRKPPLPDVYLAAADLWRNLAGDHPGTARLWVDLAARAVRTAALLGP